jgi:hypothetical protein
MAGSVKRRGLRGASGHRRVLSENRIHPARPKNAGSSAEQRTSEVEGCPAKPPTRFRTAATPVARLRRDQRSSQEFARAMGTWRGSSFSSFIGVTTRKVVGLTSMVPQPPGGSTSDRKPSLTRVETEVEGTSPGPFGMNLVNSDEPTSAKWLYEKKSREFFETGSSRFTKFIEPLWERPQPLWCRGE